MKGWTNIVKKIANKQKHSAEKAIPLCGI